ncbi:MAG TPA: BatA domain-containing protein, partial [Longimicrobiales bacterium]|nr:BatA domain-containing protein [Longimicrobiales bacterium]
MTLARPWLLAVGAALAGVVLLLHMLRRRPGPRAALPTARFLLPDLRTRLRLHLPTHPTLLALRAVVLGVLALTAAAPTLPPARTGALRIVALDVGTGMAPFRAAALDSAAAALAGGDALLVAFDSAAVVLERLDALDSLAGAGPRRAEADYRRAFLGLREAADRSAAESFQAVLITAPREGAWRPGLAPTRYAAWPAPVHVVVPERAAAAEPGASAASSAEAPAGGPTTRLGGATASASPH